MRKDHCEKLDEFKDKFDFMRIIDKRMCNTAVGISLQSAVDSLQEFHAVKQEYPEQLDQSALIKQLEGFMDVYEYFRPIRK